MKYRLFALTVLLSMLAVLALPISAEVQNPYGVNSVGCITDIQTESNTALLGGINYFNAAVTSHVQGLEDKEAIPYRVYGAVGNAASKMFVYSIGSENGLDFDRATTKQIVERFEAENPAWNAVVAINGDFFDIEEAQTSSTGEPEFPMIQLGNSYKTHVLTAALGRGILGTTSDGKMIYYTVGEKYRENGYGQRMTLSNDYKIGVLGEHNTNTVAEYTAHADRRPTDRSVVFITPDSPVRNFKGSTVYELKLDTYRRAHVGINGVELGTTGYYLSGEIVAIRDGRLGEEAPEGYAYLAVTDPEYYHLLKIGTRVKCQRVLEGEWEDVDNAIGFKQQILANGNILLKNAYGTYNTSGDPSTREWTEDVYDYPFCWKNRTAIGFKEDGSAVMLVIGKSHTDGTYKNVGASYYEIGEQLKALGCTNGFLLDGGGSSTFVIRNADGSFSNAFVGEGNGRAVANAVILAVRDESVPLPEEDEEQKITEWPKTPAKTEPTATTPEPTESEQTSEASTEAPSGCGASLAAPYLASSLCVALAVLRKKRKE